MVFKGLVVYKFELSDTVIILTKLTGELGDVFWG